MTDADAQHGGGDGQYSREAVIGATLAGAGFTALAVGIEGLMNYYGMAQASEPYFWIIPGIGFMILSLTYCFKLSSFPWVSS